MTEKSLAVGRKKERKTVNTDSGFYINPNGLTSKEALRNTKKYGRNALSAKRQKGFFSHLADGFGDPIIKILIVSLIINTLVNIKHINYPELIGICFAIITATTVSAASEYSSSKAYEKLKESIHDTCTVRRNGEIVSAEASEIAIGDIIVLSAGDKIWADGVLIGGSLSVNEAPLTGESTEKKKIPINKKAVDISEIHWSPDNPSQLFRGASVCGGEGEMCVLRVGDSTFIGKIAEHLQEETRPGPLKLRLGVLAKSISFLGYIGAFMIAFAYLFNAFFIESGMDINLALLRLHDISYVTESLVKAVTVALSAVVMAVPEGLPMLVTVVLSSNMKKMMRDNVIVRRLAGIETAGSMNVLFTDKTGTLTSGIMTVEKLYGMGFSADGIKSLSKKLIYETETGIKCATGVKGSATEKAIKAFVKVSGGGGKTHIPFSPDKKYSAGENGIAAYFLGASEKLLKKSSFYLDEKGNKIKLDGGCRSALEKIISDNAEKSVRMLCLAKGDTENITGPENLTFICFFGIKDPVRADAPAAVMQCAEAGIHVIMITGDNVKTAKAIGEACGIVNGKRNTVIEASLLKSLSEEETEKLLDSLAVVARAMPEDKIRLVKAAQKANLVVGMTGDGINDAPALKGADVGFAMGSGTEIAKEAGDIVIQDNSFSSVARAVLYGRTIFKSIRKFIVFQLLMNLSAMGISLIGPFLGVECPVTVIQMLWVNIIMDTLGGLAFAGEPSLRKYMKEAPLRRDEKILSGKMLSQIFVTGGYTLALGVIFIKAPFIRRLFGGDERYFLTSFFAFLIFCGIFNSFNARSESINILENISGNKPFIAIMTAVCAVQLLIIYFGGDVFRCTPLAPKHIALCALIAFTVIPFDIIRKALGKLIRR